MKIVFIGSAHPLRGGIATFVERMSAVMQEMGHEVTIYSFSLQYPNFLFPGTTQYTDEPAPKGLKIKTVINSVNPFNWLKVGNMIRDESPDLVILKYWIPFMGPSYGTILRRVRQNKHTKVVTIVDNMIPHEKRPGDTQFTNYFIKAVDGFVAMSERVLNDIRSLSEKPSFFSPHPVYDNFGVSMSKEEACKLLKLDPSKKYMLFFGFIRDYKGLDILLHAMGDERIKQAGIQLVVAGEYYSKTAPAEHQRIIAENGTAENIHLFTDFIPNSEVSRFFSVADVVVQPYKDATASGITQVAYNFEKPMIVTNVGGLPEVVPDGKVGFVADPNPKAIADAILKFYTPNSLPNLHENLLQEKKKYAWETFIDVVLNAAK